MNGTFKFYERGELILATRNIITTSGKRAILNFFSGMTGNPAQTFVFGTGIAAAALTDTAMNFESARTYVASITPDYANTNVIYKGRLGPEVSGSFYEVGIHSSNVNTAIAYGSIMVTSFDSNSEVWTGGAFATGSARIGSNGLRLNPSASTTATATLSGLVLDLSRYTTADIFKWAYNNVAANAASVRLRFYTDGANYFTYTVNTPTTAYRVESFNKSNFVVTGAPSWANITSIEVAVTAGAGGAADVHMDGIRIDPETLSDENGVLVSRSVYAATPIVKTFGVPIDVEYTLDLTL